MGGSTSWSAGGSPALSAVVSAWVDAHPVATRVSLDCVMASAVGLAFAQAWDPDVLFHVAWTVLALQAFTLTSLRASLRRIAFAFLCLVMYWIGVGIFPHMSPLEVAEWPLMLLISVIVAIMAEKRRLTSRRYAELYRKTSDRLLVAQEAERKLLATDLHDGVGQALSSLAITLEAAEEEMRPGDPLRRSIEVARELAASAADETRLVAGRLQPSRLGQRGLMSALRELCGRAGLPIRIMFDSECESAIATLPPEAQLQLFRIAQEAIANAVRHSGARALTLSVGLSDARIELSLEDDGCGLHADAATDRGLGLAGMHDRANVIGGILQITSMIGSGTKVSVTIARPKVVDARPGVHVAAGT